MCIYICVYICVYVCMCVCIYIYICMCVCIYIFMCVCVYVCMCVGSQPMAVVLPAKLGTMTDTEREVAGFVPAPPQMSRYSHDCSLFLAASGCNNHLAGITEPGALSASIAGLST